VQQWKKLYERDYTIQYWELACFMPENDAAFLGVPPIKGHTVFRGLEKNATAYAPTEEAELQEKAVAKYFSNPKNAEWFAHFFEDTGNHYLKTAKDVANKATLGKNLKSAYLDYWKAWLDYTSALWFSFLANEVFADGVRQLVERKYKQNKPTASLQNLLATALTPSKTAQTVEITLEAFKAKQDGSPQALENFRKKFEWFPCNDLKFEPLAIEQAKKIVSEASEPAPKPRKIDLNTELALSEEEQEYLKLASQYFYIKDWRDEFRRKGVFYALPLFKAIAGQLKIPLQTVHSLLKDEIAQGLEGKPIPQKEAKERLEAAFLIIRNGEKTQCITGKNAIEQANTLGITANDKLDATEVKIVKGIAASAGKAKGRARIVKNAAHLHKVEKGDVLIAVTTNPVYLPAMGKAIAIVTDEGGLTCHAAIVAREMGKPCVAGTKKATKIFKDGDLIEVDGIKGQARLLQ